MASNATFSCISSLFGFQFHEGYDKKRELKVVKSILRRETILMNLTHLFFSRDAYSRGIGILDVLMQLRVSSLKTIEAIEEWRTSFPGYHESNFPTPFLWEQKNYLIKITEDLDFISENVTFAQMLGLPSSKLVRNPLMLSNTLEEVDTAYPIERASRDCGDRTDSSYYEERLRIRKAERVLLVEMECSPQSADMVVSLTADKDDNENAGGIFGLTEAGCGGAKKVQQLREEVSLAYSEDVKITPEILISCVNATLPPKRLQLAGASCLMLATEGVEIPNDLSWQTFCREVIESGFENFADHLNDLSPQNISKVKAMAMKPFIRLLASSNPSRVSADSELDRAIDVLSGWIVRMLYRSGESEILGETERPLTQQNGPVRPSFKGAGGEKHKCRPSSRSASSAQRSSRAKHALVRLQHESTEPNAAALNKVTGKTLKPLLPLPLLSALSRLSEHSPLRSVDNITLPRKPLKVRKRGYPFHTQLIDDLIEGRPGPVVVTLLNFKWTDAGVADEATSGSFLGKADKIVIKAYETATSREASLEVVIKDFVSISNISEDALGSFAPNNTAWWADNIRDIIVVKESMSGHLSLSLNKAGLKRKEAKEDVISEEAGMRVVKVPGLAKPKPLLIASSKRSTEAAVESKQQILLAKVRHITSMPKPSLNKLTTPSTKSSPKLLTITKSSPKPKSTGKPETSSPLSKAAQLKEISKTVIAEAAEVNAAVASKEARTSRKFSGDLSVVDNVGLIAEDVKKEALEITEEMKQSAVWAETVANAAVAPVPLECSISSQQEEDEEYAADYNSDQDEQFVQSTVDRLSVNPQVATAREASSFSSKVVAKQEADVDNDAFNHARVNSMTQKNELAAQMDTCANEEYNEIDDYYEDDYGAEESAEAQAIISEAVGDVLSHMAREDGLVGDFSCANNMGRGVGSETVDLVSSLYGVKDCDADAPPTSTDTNINQSNQQDEKDHEEEDEDGEANYDEDFDE